MQLNPRQKQVHERAVAASIKYQKAEAEMILALQDADRVRLHRCFGASSLLKYAMKYLKLSEPVALAFIAVARKSMEVPALHAAVVEGKLSVATSNRLVSTITKQSAYEMIEFAATHSWRENERELARRNPRAVPREKVKMLGNGLVEMTVVVTEEGLKEFERARSVEAQRKGKSPTRGEVLVATSRTHLEKYDPVRKAERAQIRSGQKASKSATRYSVRTDQAERQTEIGTDSENSARTDQNLKNLNNSFQGRTSYTAAQLHAVHLRDKGCCTHIDEAGVRCGQDRWTEIHHIIPVSKGGTNDVENLTTLCSFHHDLVHQLSLPIEGQVTWLR